jgi:hypothetical protein
MFQTLISSVTVTAGGGAASIDFTSIPQTFTDLVVVYSLRNNAGAGGVSDFVQMDINGDTTSGNYAWKELYGTGSGRATQNGSAGVIGRYVQNATASVFGNGLVFIPNYTGSTGKTVSCESVTENNAAESYLSIMAMRWTGTATITSLSLKSNGGQTLSQYSTAYLYGTLKGSGGATVS